MKIVSVRHAKRRVPVYNFTVEGAHTYFVGGANEQWALVHNADPRAYTGGFMTRVANWFACGTNPACVLARSNIALYNAAVETAERPDLTISTDIINESDARALFEDFEAFEQGKTHAEVATTIAEVAGSFGAPGVAQASRIRTLLPAIRESGGLKPFIDKYGPRVLFTNSQSGAVNFADRVKLVDHFGKHGKEFHGLYKNADEYLEGARKVMRDGIPVQYMYRDSVRTGYVKYFAQSRKGESKFAFVGTNSSGKITTYHVESAKNLFKTINGNARDKVIRPMQR